MRSNTGVRKGRVPSRRKRDGSDWILTGYNGQGFDGQYAERIFALFQRLHSRDVEGTGMAYRFSRVLNATGGAFGRINARGWIDLPFTLPVSLELIRQVGIQAANAWAGAKIMTVQK